MLLICRLNIDALAKSKPPKDMGPVRLHVFSNVIILDIFQLTVDLSVDIVICYKFDLSGDPRPGLITELRKATNTDL